MPRSQKACLSVIFGLGGLYVDFTNFSLSPSNKNLPLFEFSCTEECPSSSVTIGASVRLYYVIKIDASNWTSLFSRIVNILIWTSVEVNMSIICGQYMAFFLVFVRVLFVICVGSCGRRYSWNER